MKALVSINVEEVIDNLSTDKKVQLSKDLSKSWLDVRELIEVAYSAGYKDKDILNELDWDEIKKFVINNE